MKVFSIIGAVMFCFFAYWQLNDLGQYGTQWWQGWLLTYCATALVCAVTVFKKLPIWVYVTGAVLALSHAVLRALAIQPDKAILYNPDNPAGNETGGLLIIFLWFALLAFWAKRKK